MEETRKSPEEILCLSFNQAETGGGWVEGIFWLRKDRDISSKVSKKPSWEVVEGGNFMDVYIYICIIIYSYTILGGGFNDMVVCMLTPV